MTEEIFEMCSCGAVFSYSGNYPSKPLREFRELHRHAPNVSPTSDTLGPPEPDAEAVETAIRRALRDLPRAVQRAKSARDRREDVAE